MTTLTIELPPDVYEQLRQRSEESGQSAQAVAEALLAEQLGLAASNGEPPAAPPSERERARAVLQQAGLVRGPEPSAEERHAAVQTYIREHSEEWAAMSQRERAIEVLRQSGMLTELTPEEKERAKQATMTLEEVRAALDRAGGKPLSEVIIEMRGPKE